MEDSLQYLGKELSKYGKNVQLIYGGGSIKKKGIYKPVMELLKANGKVVVEAGGVMPNPTVAGIYDIFNHICEQYFSGEDDNTCDYISEALM